MKKNISKNNVLLQYTISGQGFPVVLIHGFGEDSSVWNNQLAFLQEHCTIIIPDLPGTGNSSYTNTNKPISMESLADDIQLLLSEENISTCIMMGHSMGGYITLAFAAAYPTYLKAFGLIHSTAYADNEEKKKSRLKSIDIIEEYGGYAFLKNAIPHLFGDDFKKEFPEIVAAQIEKSTLFSNKALQQYTQAMMKRSDCTAILKNTHLPVLMIGGTEDIAAPLEDVKAQSKMNHLIELDVLEGVGHMGMLEAPDQVNRILLHFIQQKQQ